MSLAIVVNVHSRVDSKTLVEFFEVLKNVKEPITDVFVIAEENRDEIAAAVKPLVPEHRYMVADPKEEGHKLSILRNAAAAQTEEPRILFIDADCIPTPDCISRHIQLDAIAIVTAGLVLHESKKNGSEGKWRDPREKMAKAEYDIYEMRHVESGIDPRFMWVEHLSVPSRFFKEAGGFWEGLEHKNMEGQELCTRLGPPPKDAVGTTVGCVLRIDFGCPAKHMGIPALRPKKEIREEVKQKSSATVTKYPQWCRTGKSLPSKKAPASTAAVPQAPQASAPQGAQEPQAVPLTAGQVDPRQWVIYRPAPGIGVAGDAEMQVAQAVPGQAPAGQDAATMGIGVGFPVDPRPLEEILTETSVIEDLANIIDPPLGAQVPVVQVINTPPPLALRPAPAAVYIPGDEEDEEDEPDGGWEIWDNDDDEPEDDGSYLDDNDDYDEDEDED